MLLYLRGIRCTDVVDAVQGFVKFQKFVPQSRCLFSGRRRSVVIHEIIKCALIRIFENQCVHLIMHKTSQETDYGLAKQFPGFL